MITLQCFTSRPLVKIDHIATVVTHRRLPVQSVPCVQITRSQIGAQTVTQNEEENQSSNLLADFRLPACKFQVWYIQLSVQVYCLACPTQAAKKLDD